MRGEGYGVGLSPLVYVLKRVGDVKLMYVVGVGDGIENLSYLLTHTFPGLVVVGHEEEVGDASEAAGPSRLERPGPGDADDRQVGVEVEEGHGIGKSLADKYRPVPAGHVHAPRLKRARYLSSRGHPLG